jgi:hypothetical protein
MVFKMRDLWFLKEGFEVGIFFTAEDTETEKNTKHEVRNPGEMRKTGGVPENSVVSTIDKKAEK